MYAQPFSYAQQRIQEIQGIQGIQAAQTFREALLIKIKGKGYKKHTALFLSLVFYAQPVS